MTARTLLAVEQILFHKRKESERADFWKTWKSFYFPSMKRFLPTFKVVLRTGGTQTGIINAPFFGDAVEGLG